jgi:hypothetical protein
LTRDNKIEETRWRSQYSDSATDFKIRGLDLYKGKEFIFSKKMSMLALGSTYSPTVDVMGLFLRG